MLANSILSVNVQPITAIAQLGLSTYCGIQGNKYKKFDLFCLILTLMETTEKSSEFTAKTVNNGWLSVISLSSLCIQLEYVFVIPVKRSNVMVGAAVQTSRWNAHGLFAVIVNVTAVLTAKASGEKNTCWSALLYHMGV